MSTKYPETLIRAAEEASKAKTEFDAAMRKLKILPVPELTKDYAAAVSSLSDDAADAEENEDGARAQKAFKRLLGEDWDRLSHEEMTARLSRQAAAWRTMSKLYTKQYGEKSKGNALYAVAEEAGIPFDEKEGQQRFLNVKKHLNELAEKTALPAKLLLKYNDNIKKKRSTLGEALSWVFTIASVVVIVLVMRTFIFEPIRVDGTSMTDTLQDGDVVYSSKLDYLVGDIERGDVVICHYPGRTNKVLGLFTEKTRFVKRVCGLPGDTVEIRQVRTESNGFVMFEYVLYVNDEPYMLPVNAASPMRSAYPRTTLRSKANGDDVDEYFVCGDNRATSHDSRAADVGPITRDMITGKVRFVMFPFNRMGSVKPELVAYTSLR